MKKIKLFCLPYAGGASHVFLPWKKEIASDIEVIPLELAGRGKRFGEPFYHSMEHAVEDLYKELDEQLSEDSVFAMFGHSMGGLMVYELLIRLKQRKEIKPIHAFISARYPPHIKKESDRLHELPDDLFIERIYQLGGTPKEVLENEELLKLFTPILKNDYRLIHTYQYQGEEERIPCNLSVLNGRDDRNVLMSDVQGWKNYTDKACTVYEMQGGHFYLHDKEKEVVHFINQTIRVELEKMVQI
ncbi:thioesterase II family protein [Bacillus horti]|uniref:Surfactin synthase thioesterase subunit n=1 Tax=Caldalkalibacillus horti TaxID=77523 RepID=A0ABT9W431_9BACI|nr:thioesterase domain-containing protein [Bacillus horti]MDQ0167625.1 surfactin synthase thioesterase subunit [Bacillus horti]